MIRHRYTTPILALATAAALAALTGCAPRPTGESSAADTDVGHQRIERSVNHSWGIDCEPDSCGGVRLAKFSIATPAAMSAFDVVVIATLDFQINDDQTATAPPDYALIGVAYSPGCTGRYTGLNPGSFELRAAIASTPTTTSMTWTRGNLPADGATYCFQIGVTPRDGNDDRIMSVSGTRFTAVAEIWPTGP